MFYRFVQFVCWSALHLFCGFRVEGQEHIPPRPFIAAANHLTYLDPPAMGAACPVPLRFLAKEELFRPRILGAIMRGVGSIPVNVTQQDAVNTSAMKQILRVLRQGEAVAIFPEGRRNVSGQLDPAKLGVAFIALRAGVPVVPMGLMGTDQALPAGAKMLRRRRVTVRFGPPIITPIVTPAGLAALNRQAYEQLAERIRSGIAQLLY